MKHGYAPSQEITDVDLEDVKAFTPPTPLDEVREAIDLAATVSDKLRAIRKRVVGIILHDEHDDYPDTNHQHQTEQMNQQVN